VFLAELGDKTQLATLTLASGAHSRLTVFLASAAALTLSSAIAVFGGDAISRVISPVWIRRLAGLAFLGMGLLFLLPSRGE
jgi:putative Ca2+/H+ antiporter (TMEM165/GDT1 family)